MDSLCHGPLWDNNVTWYTNNPDLTLCFQYTILVWIPLLYLVTCWLFGRLFTTKRSVLNINLPWTTLMITKLTFVGILAAISLYELILAAVEHVRYGERSLFVCSAGSLFLSFLIVMWEMMIDKKNGKRSSGKLFLFWLLMIVASIIQYRSILMTTFGPDPINVIGEVRYAFSMIYHPLVFFSLFLFAFNEPDPRVISGELTEKELPPLLNESLVSIITLSWVDGVMYKGYTSLLNITDMTRVNPDMKSNVAWCWLKRSWTKELDKIKPSDPKTKEKPSLVWALCKTFWPYVLIGGVLELISAIFRFIPPLLIDKIITLISSDEPAWRGYVYALSMFVSSVISGVATHQMWFFMITAGLQIKSALMAAVYTKSLKMSSMARTEFTVGELVNLMAVDAEKVFRLSIFLNFIWGCPLRIIVTLIFLWQYLGPSCLAGVAVMVISMPITLVLANKGYIVQEKQMTLKDSRLKFLNEILCGIKVSYYGTEWRDRN